MTIAIASGSGLRSGPARTLRRCAGALLIALGLALAAGATHARVFDAALPEPVNGAPAALGHDVGSDGAFEPFAFAVVAPPEGDAAALERALEAATSNGAHMTIVLGDVLPRDGGSVVALADVVARHWKGLVLLAGPNDHTVDISDPRIAARIQPPEGWAFLHGGCLFRGSTSQAEEVAATLGEPVATFEFSAVPEPAARSESVLPSDRRFAPLVASPDRLAYEIVEVRAPDDIERTSHSVARGPSLTTLARDVALTTLWPLAASDAGLTSLLVLAIVLVWCGALLWTSRSRDSRATAMARARHRMLPDEGRATVSAPR